MLGSATWTRVRLRNPISHPWGNWQLARSLAYGVNQEIRFSLICIICEFANLRISSRSTLAISLASLQCQFAYQSAATLPFWQEWSVGMITSFAYETAAENSKKWPNRSEIPDRIGRDQRENDRHAILNKVHFSKFSNSQKFVSMIEKFRRVPSANLHTKLLKLVHFEINEMNEIP